MNRIKNILDALSATNSSIDKQEILLKEKDNHLLKKVFFLAYNPAINYYIRSIPEYETAGTNTVTVCLANGLNFLETNIASRSITGHIARDAIIDLLSDMKPSDADVLKMVIAKDLRCGVSVATINKIWKDLIPTSKVMLASSDVNNIVYPAVVQPKLDGLRAHFHMMDGYCYIESRNGKQIHDRQYFYEFVKDLMEVGEIWDGEIVCVDSFENYLSRQESNGIANKAIRGTISYEEATQMRFIAWDIITKKAPYKDRLMNLALRFEHTNSFIPFKMIESVIVESMDEVDSFYQNEIKKGNEGVVVKNPNAFWEGKRSKNLVKIKEIKDCDLIVVGWEKGTGRNSHRMGNLILETSDKKLRVSVGTGFSDLQRDEKPVIGKIAAIQYNAVINKKNSSTKSLFLPRFIEYREDKTTADSLNDLI